MGPREKGERTTCQESYASALCWSQDAWEAIHQVHPGYVNKNRSIVRGGCWLLSNPKRTLVLGERSLEVRGEYWLKEPRSFGPRNQRWGVRQWRSTVRVSSFFRGGPQGMLEVRRVDNSAGNSDKPGNKARSVEMRSSYCTRWPTRLFASFEWSLRRDWNLCRLLLSAPYPPKYGIRVPTSESYEVFFVYIVSVLLFSWSMNATINIF